MSLSGWFSPDSIAFDKVGLVTINNKQVGLDRIRTYVDTLIRFTV